jgi:hypothetical protein
MLSLLAVSWSLATPISGAPDEPAHIVKAAAVVRGQFVGKPSAHDQIVQVPKYIAHSQAMTCFAFQSNQTAACSPPFPEDSGKTVDASTSAGLYNPVYYLLVGWPSLISSDSTGIYAMRIVSAVVCSFFLAFAFILICQWRRRLLPLLGFSIAITPMVLFLNGAVNPNALEICACIATFVGMLSVVVDPRRELLAQRSVIVLIAASIAVNTRGLSPAWVLLALAVPLLLTSRELFRELARARIVQVAATIIGLATLFALIWTWRTSSLSIPPDPIAASQIPYFGASPFVGFFGTLQLTFSYAQNMVGIFGWLDTPAPVGVYFAWSALVGALTIAAAALLRRKSLTIALILIAAVVLLPAVFQAAYVHSGGIIWQGRYTLPAFGFLVIGLATLLSERFMRAPGPSMRRLAWIAGGFMVVAQFYAFATVLRRYAVGLSGSWIDLLLRPAWTPPLGVIGLLLGFAVLLVLTALIAWRIPQLAPTLAEDRWNPLETTASKRA